MDDAPQVQPPGKIGAFVGKVAGAPRRLLKLSLPTKAALVVALVLTTVVFTAWLLFLVDPESVPWRHSMTLGRVVLVFLLLIALPIVVYKVLQLWLEGESSRFPEIDFAWKAGLEALGDHGLSLDSTPLFLVLGSSGDRQEQALLDASLIPFKVRSVPAGPAPLHWYANADGIYLFCTDACWLSALATKEDQRQAGAFAPGLANPEAPASAGAPAPQNPDIPPTSTQPPGGVRGTMMFEGIGPMLQTGDSAAAATPEPPPESPGAQRGTMMLQAPISMGAAEPQQSSARHRETSRHILEPHESAEQLERLQYVCQLIKQARQPLCSINGLMTLLPFSMLQAGQAETDELERATRADLKTVTQSLDLRFPITSLVVGLEKESGFRELVRRVGRERAASQRFGKGFDLRAVASSAELTALGEHVCGAFEDWVYTLFREDAALTRPGNTRLYGLLCKVRCNLKPRLAQVLSGGFGYDPQRDSGDPLLFSGCYFAATGITEDRRAFVKSVFDKLITEQEEVEWTSGAISTDRRLHWAAYLGITLASVLGLGVFGMLAKKILD